MQVYFSHSPSSGKISEKKELSRLHGSPSIGRGEKVVGTDSPKKESTRWYARTTKSQRGKYALTYITEHLFPLSAHVMGKVDFWISFVLTRPVKPIKAPVKTAKNA